MNKNEYITNCNPGKFPTLNDGWVHSNDEWIDNGHPGSFPKANDGWM